MSQSSNLYRLQQIDSQLDLARNRINEIDRILNQETTLRKAQQVLDEAEYALNEEQKILHSAEYSANEQKLKIEQTEAALYGGKVRNPKELQDLQAEAVALKKHLVTLEERELEAMLAVENAEQNCAIARDKLSAVQSDIASQFSLLDGERLTLSELVKRLETDRQVAIVMVTSDNLSIYERLRNQRRGIAVAKAVDKSCSACGSQLTPSLIQQAITSPILVYCPTCGRIVYPG